MLGPTVRTELMSADRVAHEGVEARVGLDQEVALDNVQDGDHQREAGSGRNAGDRGAAKRDRLHAPTMRWHGRVRIVLVGLRIQKVLVLSLPRGRGKGPDFT